MKDTLFIRRLAVIWLVLFYLNISIFVIFLVLLLLHSVSSGYESLRHIGPVHGLSGDEFIGITSILGALSSGVAYFNHHYLSRYAVEPQNAYVLKAIKIYSIVALALFPIGTILGLLNFLTIYTRVSADAETPSPSAPPRSPG